MQSGKPYILFCAGEDSGDCIGETLVKVACGRFDVLGSGGSRMQNAGLCPIVEYETLPVSGFGDVVPRYLKLRKSFAVLRLALQSPLCVGLVAIDYPGFNMKLVRLAGQLNKNCLYVAPPQAWAWKSGRAAELAKVTKAKLAVFFDFEKAPYEKACCDVVSLRHPFVDASLVACSVCSSQDESRILLLPGSRKSQMMRNLSLYLNIVQDLPQQSFSFVVSRPSLLPWIQREVKRNFNGHMPERLDFIVSPEDSAKRSLVYRNALAAISAPGTATLELALSGCPVVVCTKPDILTYTLGKRFVKTASFVLPNIIAGENIIAEFIKPTWSFVDIKNVEQSLLALIANKKDHLHRERGLEKLLREKLSSGKTSEQLMSEFLAQLV